MKQIEINANLNVCVFYWIYLNVAGFSKLEIGKIKINVSVKIRNSNGINLDMTYRVLEIQDWKF